MVADTTTKAFITVGSFTFSICLGFYVQQKLLARPDMVQKMEVRRCAFPGAFFFGDCTPPSTLARFLPRAGKEDEYGSHGCIEET